MSYVYDAGADTLIRADGLAAVTATTVVAPIDFEYGFNKNVAVVINVTAIDRANADETYVLSVESADAAGANPVVIASIPTITAIGQYVMLIDCSTAQKLDVDGARIGVTATIGGTTPSLTFSAILMPIE